MTEPITVAEISELVHRAGDPHITLAVGGEGLRIIIVDDERNARYVLLWAPSPETINQFCCENLPRPKTVFTKTIKGFGAVGMASNHAIDDELHMDIAKNALATFAIIFRIPELAEKLNELAQDLHEAKMEAAALDKTRHGDDLGGFES
ncbi:MAG: hypothetical protein WBK88_00315 [Methanothrix sp.]|jgi:hypothetical protein